MKTIFTTFLILAVLVLFSGCCSNLKEDSGPVKVNRQEETRSNAETTGTKKSKDIVIASDPKPKCLIGEWPQKTSLMNIEEHKLPIGEVMQRFAKISRLNFIVADEIKGEVSGWVEKVPWTEALEAVLQTKNLVAVKDGNVARILRREDWIKEQAQ
jgi:type II secretory pathway component HofQ